MLTRKIVELSDEPIYRENGFRKDILEHFFSGVDKSGPTPIHAPELGNCWIWTKRKNNYGYGQLLVREWRAPKSLWTSNRVSWVLHNKSNIPDGSYICHKCDNPSCVRPEHLFLGTPQDNSDDMYRKGRAAIGEKSGRSKLKSDEVLEILRLFQLGVRQNVLANKFKVHPMQINCIVHRRSWKHLTLA
jgi:hypothetical protein